MSISFMKWEKPGWLDSGLNGLSNGVTNFQRQTSIDFQTYRHSTCEFEIGIHWTIMLAVWETWETCMFFMLVYMSLFINYLKPSRKTFEQSTHNINEAVNVHNKATRLAAESSRQCTHHTAGAVRRNAAQNDSGLLVKRRFTGTLLQIGDVKRVVYSSEWIASKRKISIKLLTQSIAEDGTFRFLEVLRDCMQKRVTAETPTQRSALQFYTSGFHISKLDTHSS